MRFCDFDSVKDFAAALQHQDLQIVVDFMDFEDQMTPEKVIRGGEGNRCNCITIVPLQIDFAGSSDP